MTLGGITESWISNLDKDATEEDRPDDDIPEEEIADVDDSQS
jgi:hypothetical protein